MVKTVLTQVSVASGGQDFKDAVVDGEDGDIKGAAPQVKDQHRALVPLLLQTVGQRGGSPVQSERRVLQQWTQQRERMALHSPHTHTITKDTARKTRLAFDKPQWRACHTKYE